MERNKLGFVQRVESILARPFKIMFLEPILIAITLYMSVSAPLPNDRIYVSHFSQFIYGCMYLLFEAYPIVFTEDHHMNAGASGLMFLPLPIGGAIGIAINLLHYAPKYSREVDRFAPHPVPPEYRLPMAQVGGVIFAIAFFWFGWTSYADISYWAPMMSGIFIGLGMNFIFLALINYTVFVSPSICHSCAPADIC